MGEPPFFWVIDQDWIEVFAEEKELEHTIVHDVNDRGDPCHRDLRGFSKGDNKAFFRKHFKIEDLYACEDGTARGFTQEEYETLHTLYELQPRM